MRVGAACMTFACMTFACMTFATPVWAAESACNEVVHLAVDPAGKAAQVADVLRRRLAGVHAATSVELEAAGLRVALPAGLGDDLLTRLARIEFRIVADKAEAPGAVRVARWRGEGSESVEPQIIFDESHLRELRAGTDANIADAAFKGAIDFHLDPHAMKNLMAASTEAIGRKLAILVDDKIVVDPLIRAPIASTTGEISGGFSVASAAELVKLIQIGRLPAGVSIVAREAAPCPAH